MKKMILDKIPRITKARKILEKELNVKIALLGREISITGKPEDEYISERVIEAIDFGFPIDAALMIKEEDLALEILNIKEHTKRKDYKRIRGRIIGKEGKTKNTISSLTDCFIEVKDNRVATVGHPENVKTARQAIISLIKGTKQANVYAYLEHHRPLPENIPEDIEL
jgi:ribosomal RNA assembly protein